MDCSTPGFPVLCRLLELTKTHVNWVSDAIRPSSSALPLSSCFHSFPASGCFLMSWLFTSGGQGIGASASASVLPMNIQGWFLLGWTGLISLLSKGLSSLLQHHSLKPSILWRSAFFMVPLSYPYMTTGKAIALTRHRDIGTHNSIRLYGKHISWIKEKCRPLTCMNFVRLKY